MLVLIQIITFLKFVMKIYRGDILKNVNFILLQS